MKTQEIADVLRVNYVTALRLTKDNKFEKSIYPDQKWSKQSVFDYLNDKFDRQPIQYNMKDPVANVEMASGLSEVLLKINQNKIATVITDDPTIVHDQYLSELFKQHLIKLVWQRKERFYE